MERSMRPESLTFEQRHRKKPGNSNSPAPLGPLVLPNSVPSRILEGREDSDDLASTGYYVAKFDALTRKEVDFEKRLMTHKKVRKHFAHARARLLASRMINDFHGREKAASVMTTLIGTVKLTSNPEFTGVGLKLPPQPQLEKKPRDVRRNVVCEFCAEVTALTNSVQCYSCQNVAHARCILDSEVPWASDQPSAPATKRLCCGICKSDLDARREAQRVMRSAQRDSKRRHIAARFVQQRARVWLTRRLYETRKKYCLVVQSAARRIVLRNRFQVIRIATKRAIAVRLKETSIVYNMLGELPDDMTIFGVLTVRSSDPTSLDVQWSFDLPDAPLNVNEEQDSEDDSTSHQRFVHSQPSSKDLNTASLKAVSNHEVVLPGSVTDATLVFSLYMRRRVGGHMEINHLVGQGTLKLKPTRMDLSALEGSKGRSKWSSIPLRMMRHRLRDQTTQEMHEANKSRHPGVMSAEVKVQVELLNSLWNRAMWLEGPHIDLLKKTAEAQLAMSKVTRGVQMWWATLINGVFELYSDPTGKPRVAVLAHRVVVDQAKEGVFALTFPDRHRWLFTPQHKRDAASWIYAFEYCRLKHAHSHKQAFKLFTQSVKTQTHPGPSSSPLKPPGPQPNH